MSFFVGLKYEYSFYLHSNLHASSKTPNEEIKLRRVMINNILKYLFIANGLSYYTNNYLIKNSTISKTIFLYFISNFAAISLANYFNLRLLNVYNIFTYAPPDFWVLRNKAESVGILLDDNYKVADVIKNEAKSD